MSDKETTMRDLESKEKLGEILKSLLEGLNAEDAEQYDWYCMLYPEVEDYEYEEYRGSEHVIAAKAIQHPELHPLMVQIVEKVTGIANEIGELWNDEEDHAAAGFARELAVYNKKYAPLYAQYLATNDLNHEVYQSEDIWDILHEKEWDKDIYPIVVSRVFTPGQHGREDWAGFCESGLTEALMKDGEMDVFFDVIRQFFDEKWGLDYGHSVRFGHFGELAEMIYPDDENKAKDMNDRFESMYE
ncbi:MAG: hypothetical protein LBV43_04425 [Prevotella sp.]|jgi:hypothetical protein|nr:hypothetical protein [Prevotella sp.]